MSPSQISQTLSCLSTDQQVQYENYQVVSLVQALWGAISSNMVAISLRCMDAAVNLHFYLQGDSLEDREAIAEIEVDLLALQFTNVPLHSHVHIVGSHIDVSQVQGRMVYLRHAKGAA